MNQPSRVLWVDATAGASGDMLLGALVDLGVPLSVLRAATRSLPLRGFRLSSRRVMRRGLAARKVDVHADDSVHGRRFSEVRRILRQGRLDPAVRDRAVAIFRRLFQAEAAAHGGDPETIHLHEAGAVDAIVDVVGACAGLAHLAPRRIVVSPLTTGSGRVDCAHGSYPVPGPAVTALLSGVPASSGGAAGERLTPTGAAILVALADGWGGLPAMRILSVGHGAGTLDFADRPNVMRLILGEETEPLREATGDAPEVVVVEASVDDATPQLIAWTTEKLREAGALDVHVTPVVMKKGRPGQILTAVGRPDRLADLAGTILRETTTLGVRWRRESRVELERTVRALRTPFGTIRVKIGKFRGATLQAWPEYEDCAAAARRVGAPLKAVQLAALRAVADTARAAVPRRRRKERA